MQDTAESLTEPNGPRTHVGNTVTGSAGKFQRHIRVDGAMANIVGTKEECDAFPAWFRGFYNAPDTQRKLETATNVVRDFEAEYLGLLKRRRASRRGPLD